MVTLPFHPGLGLHVLIWHSTQAHVKVNWGPSLGWGWIRPLAVPYSAKGQVGLWAELQEFVPCTQSL